MFSDVPFFLLTAHNGPWGWLAGSFPLTSVVRLCGPAWICHACLMLPDPSHTIWTRNTASWFRSLITSWTIRSPGLYIFSKQSRARFLSFHFCLKPFLSNMLCLVLVACSTPQLKWLPIWLKSISSIQGLDCIYMLFHQRCWLHLCPL